MPSLFAGSAHFDITPTTPCALSGFIARRNRPFERVDDALHVRALALAQDGELYLLLNYELLGFGPPVRDMLLDALAYAGLPGFELARTVITTPHTHSGPAVSPIEGESGAGEDYLELLRRQTVAAAREALASLQPAVLEVAEQAIDGLTYNRRAVLADGRVSIAYDPDQPVLERGPLDNTLTLLAWKTADDPARVLGALVNFACHGVSLLTAAVSGDIPGQIMACFEERLGAPCLFLQGPAGDVNPVAVAGERSGLLAWMARFRAQTAGLAERLAPANALPLRAARAVLPLDFRPLPERSQVALNLRVLEQLGAGDFSALDSEETAGAVANLLNIRPGDAPDAEIAAFTARAMAGAERRVLALVDSGQQPAPYPLEVSAWRVGAVLLVCVGAEFFSSTGLRLRALGGENVRVLPVAYAAPIVGYLPDAHAMQQGGYEANDAWRFYGQPGPFAFESEARLAALAAELVNELLI